MHADTTHDLDTLNRDLQSEQVIIRYRKEGGEGVVETGRAPCGSGIPQAEVVMIPTLVVWKHCGCSRCNDREEMYKEVPTRIRLDDVVDIEARDWETGYPPEEYPDAPAVLARWLRSRFWKLKRLALDD